jgi:hypothetical protein
LRLTWRIPRALASGYALRARSVAGFDDRASAAWRGCGWVGARCGAAAAARSRPRRRRPPYICRPPSMSMVRPLK